MGLAYGLGIYYRRSKVAGTIKITRKVHFEINAIDPKKKKKKKIYGIVALFTTIMQM
jgi:hypothetical protein